MHIQTDGQTDLLVNIVIYSGSNLFKIGKKCFEIETLEKSLQKICKKEKNCLKNLEITNDSVSMY